MKKVRDNSAVPRGGTFTYVHENNYTQQHPYFDQLKHMVVEYKNANNLPVGLQFDDEFEENLCAHAADSTCEDFIPPTLLEKMSHLAQALYKSAKSGFATVPAEEFESRRAVCGSCNFFGGTNGLLKIACKKCGCSGIKLAVNTETCPAGKW